ncbi:amidohydrolase family protein [Paraburkholderia sp. RL17-347-BIC-D]|uniref:amidohydrolase family protein n=1 Tax=Paraburkholderia sp. RL17-347-BIC-D TaxID=3031632 RepID=UPI0038B9ABEC
MSSETRSHNAVRLDWLATQREDPLDPGQPIVDAHHHLYDRPGSRYLLDDILTDLRSGHNVLATVFVQARAMHRASGPEAMKSIGETEFANGIAAMCASGSYGNVRVCEAIVGFADLRIGGSVQPVLEAHIAAAGGPVSSGGRFRGIRQIAAWDPDSALLNPAYPTSEDMFDTPEFRAGFARLAPSGLSFDTWLFFHQIPRLTALARAFPQTPIAVNHCGGILGIGRYAGRRKEVFAQWSASLSELAACPNVVMKLGGLGMRLSGFEFDALEHAPSSIQLAEAWRPWIETCIEAFGPERCMFESNFPVDKGSYSYGIGWNAMKRLVAGASTDEKTNLFWRSASRFYRLQSLPARA